MRSSHKVILLSGAAIIIVVLLSMMPRLPESVRNKKTLSPIDAKITRAVKMVRSGDEPMRGIMLLREVLEEDSTNAAVHWHLGQFSIQSGQYDKAADRFRKVVKYDDSGEYRDAWFYLGRTYATLGDSTQALSAFKKYLTLAEDTAIITGVERFVRQLEGTPKDTIKNSKN